MKNIFTLGLLLLGTAIVNAQTSYIVYVGNNGFTDSNLTVNVGDDVSFMLDVSNSSGSHTSTTTSVPSGAATWDYTCFCSACKYTSVITVAGTYEFMDSNTGKTGTITTTPVTGMEVANANPESLSQNHPNPFSGQTSIDYNLKTDKGSLMITDITGKIVKEYALSGKSGQITISENLNAGMYFYSLKDNNKIVIDRKKMQVVK